MRRKRFQRGSLQARKHGRHRVWVAFWREDGIRRCKMLGRQSQMSRAEAEAVLAAILQAVNHGAAHVARPVYTFEQFANPPGMFIVRPARFPIARRFPTCPTTNHVS